MDIFDESKQSTKVEFVICRNNIWIIILITKRKQTIFLYASKSEWSVGVSPTKKLFACG